MNEGINKSENYKPGNLFDGEPEIPEVATLPNLKDFLGRAKRLEKTIAAKASTGKPFTLEEL